jgi:pyruvate dehydrogenase E1 component alpha subunit
MGTESGTIVARFEIRRRNYLSPAGEVVAPLPESGRDIEALVAVYKTMMLTRTFDTKAVALQRTGRLGTYAVSTGQEATDVGTASVMNPEDVLLLSYRGTGAQIWRGVEMDELLAYWGGDERGNDFAGPRHDFPASIPVGSHAPHAAGVACAFKLRREPRVAVCMFGDGATSKGDVWEALNFSGVARLPVVYVVTNNQWAISVPLARQTAAQTLAQKAIAAGISGEQVDGNDAIAVRAAVGEAVAAARNGCGPSRYRSDKDVSARWAEEPIARLRKYLLNAGAWNKSDEEMLAADCQKRVEEAVEKYLSMQARAPETMFDCLYAELPSVYARQRDSMKRRSGDD